MNYKFLSESLHSVAETAAAYFRDQQGVRHIEAEVEVEADILYKPTLQGKTQDHYSLCVDVTDAGFSTTLESFVLTCGNRGLPVKCVVAVPEGVADDVFRAIQRKTLEYGVGLLEVGKTCKPVHGAMPFTLFGYRRPDPKRFPAKYRQALVEADNLLRGGDPAKACSKVYDELESLSRRIAEKINTKQLWRPLHQGEKRPRISIKKGAWKTVMDRLVLHLDYTKVQQSSPLLTSALIGKVAGIVPHRNDTGHKPGTKAALLARDRELRTRFEHAVDTLEELVRATKFLGV